MTDDLYMAEALRLAKRAYDAGETPVGAVVVSAGLIVGRGHNLRESLADVTAHAEIIAIRSACASLGRWRLHGCTMYVTLEPCPMCAGCIVQARFDRVVYGADEFRGGAMGSVMNLAASGIAGRPVSVTAGVMMDESAALLRSFFGVRRS